MSNEKPRTLVGWVAANPVASLAILGAGFYTALRFAQRAFYGPLGLTPEDVGLGRAETLTHAVGIAFYVLAGSTLVVLLFVAIEVIAEPMERWLPSARTGTSRRVRDPFTIFGLLAACVFLVFLLWFEARHATDAVRRGEKVHPNFIEDTGIHAEKAKITWVGDAPRALVDLPTHRLMFMGQSGGSAVLYDVDDKRSIRVPSSIVAVSILP